jgi:phenylacetate-coenzyme A ligase PaaK-like adenylate-forming protein
MWFERRLWSALMRRAVERATLAEASGLARASEARAIAAFQRAAREVPAYRSLLAASFVASERIVTIEDFHRLVPVVNKQRLFEPHGVPALCANGQMGEASLVFMSSGYSGAFSFGLETRAQAAALERRLDALFDFHFRVATRRTLLINALPGSVRVPSRYAVVAELGPRPDAVLRALAALVSDFEQIVLVAEPLLVKAVVDGARDTKLELDRHRVHVITGGEFVTEGFRRYIGRLLAHDEDRPDRGQVFTSFGVSELGLSLAHDTPELRRIGRAFAGDPVLCTELFGDVPYAPTLLQYFPDQHYLETPRLDARPSLIATTLDPSRPIPLVRYASGDWAEVLPQSELARRLERSGQSALIPSSRLPLLALWGRGGALEVDAGWLYVERVKAALYDDVAICSTLSGRFRLLRQGNAALVCVERRAGAPRLTPPLEARFGDLVAARAGFPVAVRWEEPGSAVFGGGFEQKTRYLS